jgi:tetratricopeptide (TPR) repeat protein
MRTSCDDVANDLSDLVAGDRDAIARHAEHLASCDSCRDARHDATQLASRLAHAGDDHVSPGEVIVDRLMEALGEEGLRPQASDLRPKAEPVPVPVPVPAFRPPSPVAAAVPATASRRRVWMAAGAAVALAAGTTGIYFATHRTAGGPGIADDGSIAHLTTVSRAAADHADGVSILLPGATWRPLRASEAVPAGAQLRTDERTRASLDLADGSHLVLDHLTTVAFDPAEPRHLRLTGGRLLTDFTHIDGRPAQVATPAGTIDVVGTRFVTTATDALTSVQVVRGQVALRSSTGEHDDVRAGEEGTIENHAVSVSPLPQLAHEVEWAELSNQNDKMQPDETTAGLGALRAYKPGESRDRDWNLALAKHDVKVRIVGPIARTEITETFRNDSAQELEGVYQFPLPPDAQIDGLALDSKDGFVEGAFVDKERGAKIWKGVIDKAAPKKIEIATDRKEIIWVDGSWRDPALLDWKRGGRFELRIFPIPAKGQRTIKLAYTQVVAPHGEWRQYVYPLPHSKDGSTVADQLTVDLEIRGAVPGVVRTTGYDLRPDPARTGVTALTMQQAGFVPRGDLVVAYRATDGAAELRAWTYAGNAAVAPDEALAAKKDVGIDPKVIDAQRTVAADTRPTAVLALRPKLPRWQEAKARDYMIVLDASQSTVGERFTREIELAASLVEQMDRRDRFSVMTCDSECRRLGDLRSPTSQGEGEMKDWLGKQTAAGATDVVESIRAAREALSGSDDREKWVLYVGDGFASTGFRRVADVERALAGSGVRVTTIGIGTDADSSLLAAAARGGGGSFLEWTPGERTATAAYAALESTYGTSLRDAKLELPAGLADVAPTTLPTLRAGEEVLVAARIDLAGRAKPDPLHPGGDVQGEVVLRGTVAGQPFVQRYPLKLAVSTGSGNSFVPRLWASLAIEQREQAGTGDDRAQIVALSQAYGVMSRDTSLLVLESQAMFDAFGIDRHVPTEKWSGEESIDEVASQGTLAVASKDVDRQASANEARAKSAPAAAADNGTPMNDAPVATATPPAPVVTRPVPARHAAAGFGGGGIGYYPQRFAMVRTWIRVPAITAYDTVSPSISKAIADAERALAKSPDSREKHRALVQALSYAGEIERARDVANKWLDRDRLDPQALGYQADLLGRAGQRELALRTLAGLVDLDADRSALHERMVQAYEQIGRAPQACSHRIALAAIAPKDAKLAGAAIHCLRALGRHGDAELVARALPDDAARDAAEKVASVDEPAPKVAGDLVVAGHWTGADLDISLVTPDGTRVSWMGGKSDAIVTDANSSDREQLAVKSLKKGNYLIEVSRGEPSTGTIHGTLDITALGSKRSLPFDLAGDRTVVARVSISLEERVEQIDPYAEPGTSQPRMIMGTVSDEQLRRVMMARSPQVRACYEQALQPNPTLRGRIILTIHVLSTGYGQVQLETHASAGMEQVADCMKQQLATMHTNPTGATLRVPFNFVPN